LWGDHTTSNAASVDIGRSDCAIESWSSEAGLPMSLFRPGGRITVAESNGSHHALVFLSLFGCVFAVAGFAVGVTHIPEALQNDNTESLVLCLVFATLFPAVGFGLIWLGLFNRRRINEQAQLLERYPDQSKRGIAGGISDKREALALVRAIQRVLD
jgi:hypothetical protein